MPGRFVAYAEPVNRDVKSGLAILCVAAIFGIIWLALSQSDDPSSGSGAGMIGAMAVIAAVAGLVVVIKGLVSD